MEVNLGKLLLKFVRMCGVGENMLELRMVMLEVVDQGGLQL